MFYITSQSSLVGWSASYPEWGIIWNRHHSFLPPSSLFSLHSAIVFWDHLPNKLLSHSKPQSLRVCFWGNPKQLTYESNILWRFRILPDLGEKTVSWVLFCLFSFVGILAPQICSFISSTQWDCQNTLLAFLSKASSHPQFFAFLFLSKPANGSSRTAV